MKKEMSTVTRRVTPSGRVGTPNRKRNSYRTRSYNSDVDETLFGSPARFNAQKDTTRIHPEDVTWDPPWVTSPQKNGAPLLWTPYDSKDTAGSKNAKPSTPRRPTTPKNRYRLKSQVPSYVDETLFGTPRKSHHLETPWATDDDSTSTQLNQVTWSPPLQVADADISIDSRKIEAKGVADGTSMHYTPVIKARPGSTLNTPQSRGVLRHARGDDSGRNLATKLDFCIENGANDGSSVEHDPDMIIERALKLAGISRNSKQPRYRSNSLDGSSRASTPGRYFWKIPSSPSSSTGRPVSGMSGQFSARSTPKKTELKADDLFSATGTRVPLSARGTGGRPDTARTATTADSVPGLDLSKPSRLYSGSRSARSARSASSDQSSILNRPSWRP